MDESLSEVVSKFFPRGSRNTPLKRAIFKAFVSNKRPLSIPEIQATLRKSSVNKTSLYRQLNKLVEAGAISEVMLSSGVQHYELAVEHHHHFICQNCDFVEDIHHEELESSVKGLERELNYRGLFVRKHEFNLFGLCNQCIS